MRTSIRGAQVFDGQRNLGPVDVVLHDAVIAAVGGAAERADVEIDGTGHTLLPGLIDAHTHVFDGSLAAALRHGVTTELDMFCLPEVLAGQRRLAAERDDVADFRSPGTLATAPGGHPTQLLAGMAGLLDGVGTTIDFVESPAQAPAFVEARLAEGADYLKIVIDDGAVHGADLPALSPETVAALTESAHDAGLRVIAHAVTAAEVAIALDAGVDGLAHVWTDLAPGDPATAALADRLRAHGAFVVTTLAYFEAITAQRVRTADCARPGSSANAAGAVRALHRAGVPLLAGTDATPFVPEHGAGLHRELELLVAAGLTPEQSLVSATGLPAQHFGLRDRGRIAPGLRADLVLVQGDPIRDITATRRITEVWRRGVRQPDHAPHRITV
ncbi:amidohydrolase family protein [Nocardia sp. NPDC048505]|uniref:amidohydrolase family protein n=1 Tax=unclassified Nocardia TaxID=2637762 RepID=UPI00340A4919